jgi:hypothetical protein
MRKKIHLILLLFVVSLTAGGAIFFSGWLQMGNTLQRTSDGYKYRTALGSPGFVYWYQQYQVDSVAALKQNLITTGTNLQYFRGDFSLATIPTNYITLSSLSGTTPIIYNTSTGAISIGQATTSTNGFLPSTDWNTFNNKQPAGNYITALTGDGSASGPGSVSFTLATVNSNVGSFGDASHSITEIFNAKGLGTSFTSVLIQLAESQVTNLVTDLSQRVQYSDIRNAANFGLTASLADVGHYANPTGDQTYRVGGWINFLPSSTGSVTMQVTYTDNHGLSKTKTFFQQGSTTASITVVDDYAFPTMDFRVLSGTTVQVFTTATGSVIYEAGCTIQKIQGF